MSSTTSLNTDRLPADSLFPKTQICQTHFSELTDMSRELRLLHFSLAGASLTISIFTSLTVKALDPYNFRGGRAPGILGRVIPLTTPLDLLYR